MRLNVSSICRWSGDNDCIVSPDYVVFRCEEGLLGTDFFDHFRKSHRWNDFIENAGHGSVRVRIYLKDLAPLKINIPPLKEQKKIAQILSTWDKAIETVEKLIENSKARKKALMQQLLTGKKRFKEFEGEEWLNGKLGTFIEKIIGGGTPKRSIESYWNGNIPWVTVKDLTSEGLYDSAEHISHSGLKNSASHLIPKGTVIIAARMALGKAVMALKDMAINQDLKAIFPKKNLSPKYLHYWLLQHSVLLEKLGYGSTVKGIPLSNIKNLKIYFPSSQDEQKRIVKFIENAFEQVRIFEEQSAILKEEKKALMQQLLTGKRRVKTDNEQP